LEYNRIQAGQSEYHVEKSAHVKPVRVAEWVGSFGYHHKVARYRSVDKSQLVVVVYGRPGHKSKWLVQRKSVDNERN
jgi:hypothetical protein